LRAQSKYGKPAGIAGGFVYVDRLAETAFFWDSYSPPLAQKGVPLV
jgi:hypothetical protein